MPQTFFLVDLSYICPLEEVDKHKNAHIVFLKEFYAQNNFIFSGPKTPRTGGVILAQAKSKEDLETILAQDPFSQNNLAKYTITEFTPVMFSEQFKNVIQSNF